MRSTIAIVLSLLLTACGGGGDVPSDSDGAVLADGGRVIVDAMGDSLPDAQDAAPGRDGPDAGPPPDYVDFVWERLVIPASQAIGLYGSVMLPTGVVVIGRPDMVLYAPNGDELVRVTLPASNDGIGVAIARGSGDLAAAEYDGEERFVQEYDGTTLIAGLRTPLGTSVNMLLGEVNSTLYVLEDKGQQVELHTLSGGTVVDTKPMVDAPGYLPARMLTTTDGKLMFCAMTESPTTVQVIRLDPLTAEFTRFILNDTTAAITADGCQLTAGANGLHALWRTTSNEYEWALLSSDGTAIVNGPHTAADVGLDDMWAATGVVYVGGQFVAVSTEAFRLKLYGFNETTGVMSSPKDVWLNPGGNFIDSNAALASDGNHLYVSFAPSALPQIVRLQKIPPLSAEQP